MLTADYIVASDSAKFVSRYANIGLTPDLGVSTLLPPRSASAARCSCCCRTRTLDAAEALDWGLVAEVVPASEVASRAEAVAQFWLDNATGAFGQAKRLDPDRRRPDVRREPRRRGGLDRRPLRHR